MSNYVLAQGFAAAQYWNDDKSDLLEIRRESGQPAEVPADIPKSELDRLVKLGAVVEADSLKAQAPAKSGPADEPAGNAGRDEWAKYADSLGLTFEPNAGREDIKKLIADSRG